jgi:aspartate carbamoyltransferase catalytic subunit
LVAPRLLAMRQEVRSYLQEHGVEVHEATSIQDVASEVDVIYLTRAHTPRFEHARRFDTRPEAREPAFGLDVEVIERLSAEARVLHPLPRGPELPPEFDADPRIACFRQAHNGLWIRMALLTLLAG